jgi:hypothetical protein
MRVTRYLQVAFVLTAFVTLGACSSMGGHHQDQDGGVAYASVTWDSGPLDRDYQVQLTDMENRHNQEAAHPREGESSDQMTQRQTAEHQDLSKRYAQGEASHAQKMPPSGEGQH